MGFFDNFKNKYFNLNTYKPVQQQPQQVTPQIIPEVKDDDEETYYSFPVAGISFHDKELKKIIKNNLELGRLQKFCGFSNRDLIDFGYTLDIFETQHLEGVHLEVCKYNGKDAIKVLIDDTTGNYLEVGYVPNNHLKQMIEVYDKIIYNITYEILGGSRKTPSIDDLGKDIVETEKLNYGIIIRVYYK